MTPHPAAADAHEAPSGPLLARLGRTYQLEGALHVRPECEEAALALTRTERVVVSGHGVLRVRFVRTHGAGLVMAFQGFRSPERAQALVNAAVHLHPDDAAALPEAAHGVRAGLPVTLDGAPYGVVEAVIDGPQRLLRILGPDGAHLVPAGAPYVQIASDAVALRDPPPGLLGDVED